MTGRRKIVDLTFPIHEGMTTFPGHWHPMVEITQMGRHGIENRETRKILFGTHTGTHVDAPSHFIEGGRTIDEVPLERLMGPATVVRLQECAPLQEVSLEQLKRAVGAGKDRILLLRYDWSRQWGKLDYYRSYPFLSDAAARWIVARGTQVLGMDTPSSDNPAHCMHADPDSPNHKILLGAGIILVEYLCNLDKLKSRRVEFSAMPLKIRGADGSPARCLAIDRP